MSSVTYKGYQLDYDYVASTWSHPWSDELVYCMSETPRLRGTLKDLQAIIDEWERLAELEDG